MGSSLRPILGVLSIPLLTYGVYTYALDAQRGVRPEFTGRRARTRRAEGVGAVRRPGLRPAVRSGC